MSYLFYTCSIVNISKITNLISSEPEYVSEQTNLRKIIFLLLYSYSFIELLSPEDNTFIQILVSTNQLFVCIRLFDQDAFEVLLRRVSRVVRQVWGITR